MNELLDVLPMNSLRVPRQKPAMEYPRIEEHRVSYPTRWMCSALGVSDRGFRSWKSRGESKRRKEDRRLLIDIRSSFENSEWTYGSQRILLSNRSGATAA